MHFHEGIDLPDEVLEAHATGNLVFFVGAGASMSPPSNLPSFTQLAEQLGELARIPFSDHYRDKIDTFIGSLPSGPGGFDAHRHAAALLQREESKPNDVHRALVRLATSGPAVRIVTTNFDEHLSIAASELGVDVGDRWIGPAVPLGRAFNGIVHLHGSLTRHHKELILNDQDFGRAYFGDGWAPRFLQPMFEQYVVLFVGYSLTDTVMRYLTLGLPSKTRRYALVAESEATREDWRRLEVSPIPYPNDDERHTNLPRVLEEWAHWARMRQSEHEERMQELISLWEPASRDADRGTLPMFSKVEEDYLKSQISTIDGARTFASIASATEWLDWLDGLPSFTALFAVGGEISEVSTVLASWFADRFVADPAKSASGLESLRRHKQVMHPALRRQVTFGVHALEQEDALAARRWRTMLATSIHGYSAPSPLEDLLSFRAGADPIHNSLARKALTPYLHLSPSFSAVDRSGANWPRVEIRWPLNKHYLAEHVGAWIAKQEASAGLSVLETALVEAYELLAAYNGNDASGPLEWARSAIEPHSQDQFASPIDVVIDGLRDLGVQDPGATTQLHDRWWSLGYGLFRRLALHLVALSTQLTSDEKLRWVISRGAIFGLLTKHEAFQVLSAAVPDASPDARSQLLEVVLAGDPTEQNDERWPRTRDYEIYNLLVWLTRADPSWQTAADELNRLQAANADFGPREHPDFSMWHESGTWSEEPALPVEDFRIQTQLDPGKALLLLEHNARDEWPGEDHHFRKDFALIREMTAQAPMEGLALWKASETSEIEDKRRDGIRAALLNGWTSADLGDVAVDVLARVRELASTEEVLYPAAEFLLEQTRKLSDGPATDFLADARDLAVSMWDQHRESFRPHVESDPSTLALNTWPGTLVYFWLAQVQQRWRHAGDSWDGLNEEERAALKSLLDGPPEALKAIWPAMASELNFIHAADPRFAEQWVLPLFSRNESLRSAWGSFLYHPRCNLRLLEAGLLNAIVDTFARLSVLNLDRLEGQFESFAASVVNFAGVTARDRGRLLDAAVIAEGGQHAAPFAEAVVRQLDDDTQVAQEVWTAWLRDHIALRLTGVPRDATEEEIARWADIVPHLGDSVPEAIELLQGRGIGLGGGFFAPDFSDSTREQHAGLLVGHYAERIWNTNPGSHTLGLEIRQLIDELVAALGESAVEAIVESARDRGFIRH